MRRYCTPILIASTLVLSTNILINVLANVNTIALIHKQKTTILLDFIHYLPVFYSAHAM